MEAAVQPGADSRSQESTRLKVPEAAKFLGVSPGYVHKKAAAGLIPSYKVGKYLEFELADLEKYREAKKRGGAH